jgi:hypothetical protein
MHRQFRKGRDLGGADKILRGEGRNPCRPVEDVLLVVQRVRRVFGFWPDRRTGMSRSRQISHHVQHALPLGEVPRPTSHHSLGDRNRSEDKGQAASCTYSTKPWRDVAGCAVAVPTRMRLSGHWSAAVRDTRSRVPGPHPPGPRRLSRTGSSLLHPLVVAPSCERPWDVVVGAGQAVR